MNDIPYELPNGTNIEHYRIEKTISAGGFSLVYFAKDTRNQQPVVIKEYLPKKLAKRIRQHKVTPLKPVLEEAFMVGRKLFFQEASTLAKLKHPNIVNVNNFFDANDTVYMVMDYKAGKNLETYIRSHQGHLSETMLRTIFLPLCDGLIEVHKAGLLHLDIKPGNIHLQAGGNPILLDFGAVHRMEIGRLKQPPAVVTHGFSPVEQHDPKGYVGPWTDIYALGATLWACIEGKAPPNSNQRYENDSVRPAVDAFKRHYSQSLLRTIDKAMEVDAMLRPQSVMELVDIFNDQSDIKETVIDRLVSNLPWRVR